MKFYLIYTTCLHLYNIVLSLISQRFFEMMRESCDANDHPDSNLFIQMYRLISTYSLVKPPRSSNFSSTEIFDLLLSIEDIEDAEQRKEQWEAQWDTILDTGGAALLKKSTRSR